MASTETEVPTPKTVHDADHQVSEAAHDSTFAEVDSHERIVPAVEFRDVHLSFDGRKVLDGLSFKVMKGETKIILGGSGGGKSTTIKLVLGLLKPDEGRILVDGVDIRDMDLGTLRKMFGLVLQDVHLFSGTIAGNIRLGDDSIDDARVRDAARAVHAHRFIESLPGGYDAPVAERGATLSVGQKQLLSFARALAFDPAVLVLDEATSSVDTETELLIRDALHVLMSGRTTLAIAHRLSTIQDMDNILVFHKGRLCEAGTHQRLLGLRGIYYKLFQLQYKAASSLDARQAEARPPVSQT